jgi:C4-dicarboxylate-specific signal transduction histidine kinase
MSRPSAILSYGLAVLLFATALVAELWLYRILNVTPSLSLFLCAIMFVAWFGGTGPGLLATALTILAFDYFFIPPMNSFAVLLKDVPRLAIFAIAAVLVVSLSTAQRRTATSLRRARDELEEKVRELAMLNKALRGENDERERAEEALRIAQAELAHVTRMTTLGEMSASIAHEVKQPLAAIVINGEAGERWLTREPPKVDEALKAIKRTVVDANRASEVIRRLRDLSKKADPEMAPLDLNAVIDDAVSLVKPEALRQSVTMQLELAPELPPLRGDRIQLQQVIINLVINGFQAMSMVTDRRRLLFVRTQQHGSDHVLVAVQDAGVGIEPENLGRLFSAFYTTKPDGMGMGLSICRSIVEAHGGLVWATPNTGAGMTFHFTIPRVDQAASSLS